MIPTRYFDFVTSANIPMRARVVYKGDRYGLRGRLVHGEQGDNGAPMVEFYDRRYPHTEHGQYIGRYYVSTLKESLTVSCGLDLLGYEPAWKIDGTTMLAIMNMFINRIEEELK